MQDYSSLTLRCKNTSLNIFSNSPGGIINLFQPGLFGEINVFSYKNNPIERMGIDFIIDRIARYGRQKYAFYLFPNGERFHQDLLIYMMRWITIYDAVFLVNGKNETISDFGLFSESYFENYSEDKYDSLYVKYIKSYEIKNFYVKDKFSFFTKLV